MLDLNKKLLKKSDFDEDMQMKAISYYYDIMEQMAKDVNQRKNEYPFNIENIFTNKLVP